jgi:2-polyprenyl-3-methyl-5-hydroxy-6-metoxy-1,4-benzoquinol methylase
VIPSAYPALRNLVERQLAAFPEHDTFLSRRFSAATPESFAFANQIATKILQIAGSNVDGMCRDYRWLSGVVLEEELHFRRTGRYRLETFEQADRALYSNPEMMNRYMNGLLASQLWWRNHTDMLHFFSTDFVRGNRRGYTHLEIGPGHGLLLYFAAASPDCAFAEAWDVSETSLSNTREALCAMGLRKSVSLSNINLFDAPKTEFTSIAFSEVLEHLEKPQGALRILHRLLADEGRIFVNAPVNSPAPDHLHLFETPEQVLGMISAAGFAIESSRLAPCTGATIERARKHKMTISVGVIARKA